jgi:hypothetical protein
MSAIEPILAHEKRTNKFTVAQRKDCSHEEADKYLKENVSKLMAEVKIIVTYKDEFDSTYYTEFEWNTNKNTFPSWMCCSKLKTKWQACKTLVTNNKI